MQFNVILSFSIILIICNDTQGLRNGNLALSGNFQYQVFLVNALYNPCSGVIIDERHILTVAHCVWSLCPNHIVVFAGTVSFYVDVPITRTVQRIHLHEHFNPYADSSVKDSHVSYHLGNDVAMLTLESPLLLGTHVEKVPLPMQDIGSCPPQNCYITGWSTPYEDKTDRPGHLVWTRIMILLRLHCLLQDIHLRENEFCAETIQENTRVLPLDTGGGLLCDGILVGIIMTSNSDQRKPIIYANVYDFKDFIHSVMMKDGVLYSDV